MAQGVSSLLGREGNPGNGNSVPIQQLLVSPYCVPSVVCPGASYLIPMCLSFFKIKMKVIVVSAS